MYSSIIIGSLMLMIGVAFPKDNQAIAEYVKLLSEAGLDALFSSVDVNAPGWLFWVSLMGSSYIYIISAIVATRIGSRLFPTHEGAGLELIASSPRSARLFYVENIGAALMALLIIFLPSYVILSIYSLIENSPDSIPRLGAMFILNVIVAMFYVSLSSLPSIFRFSKGTGSRLGYFYLFSSFLIEFTAGSIEKYRDLANYSVNYYISPSSGLLNGEFNWTEAGVVLGISTILFCISLFLIKQPEYIEKVSGTGRKISFKFIPKFSPSGRIARKYPLYVDQFRKDRTFFFIWGIAVNFAFYYIALIFNVAIKDDPTVLEGITASFGGIMDVFTFGYTSPPNYTGFLTFEVFGLLWLYFGLFVFIPAINIPSRDQVNEEQDLIWSNSLTPEKVIVNRTLGLLTYFAVYYWISFFVLWSTSFVLNLEINAGALLKTFIVGFFYFSGLIFLFVGIAMLFPIRQGKKIVLWYYISSIILLIASFLVPAIDFIKYFSIVYYFDPVGIMLEKIDVLQQFVIAIIVIVLSVVIYYLALVKRYRNVDLMM